MKYLLIFCFFASSVLSAQNITVYYLKGEATIQVASKTSALKENAVIAKGSKITVKEGGQVVLFQAEKAVVLKDAKSYSFIEIEKQFAESKRGISDRYIAYLWNSANERDKSNGQKNVSVTGMVSRGRGEGINFPMDSSTIITDAMSLEIDEEMLPAYLYIYDRKKVIFKISATDTHIKIYNMALLEKGKWYGMAVSSEDLAPYASIIYMKWATPQEAEAIRKEIGTFYAEIADLPLDVQSQLIHAFEYDKRYIGQDD